MMNTSTMFIAPKTQLTRQACFRTGDKPKVVIPPRPKGAVARKRACSLKLDALTASNTPSPNRHARHVLGQEIDQKRLSPLSQGSRGSKASMLVELDLVGIQQTCNACFRTGDKPKAVIPPIPREQRLESKHARWELDLVGIQQTHNVCFRTGDKPKVVISPVPKEQRLKSEHARGPGKVQ